MSSVALLVTCHLLPLLLARKDQLTLHKLTHISMYEKHVLLGLLIKLDCFAKKLKATRPPHPYFPIP